MGLASPAPLLPTDPTVGDVVALFLQHAKTGSARAAADRKLSLDRFCAVNGGLRLADAKPYHLRLWVDSQSQYRSDWTIKRVISDVKRPFSWAMKLGITDRNPFLSVSHRNGERGRPVTPAEWRALLVGSQALFRRVLIFLRFTGARPCEMAAAKWIDLDIERGAIVLHKHKTATTQAVRRPRVIVLHPVLLKLLAWQRRHLIPEQDHIFINAKGRPWTRYAIACRLKQLRKKIGLHPGCKIYGLRHKFGSDCILNGVELKTLAELMGHTSTRTTEIYVHIAGNVNHLKAALGQAFGKSTHSHP